MTAASRGMDLLDTPEPGRLGEKLRIEGSRAGTHLELESELRARLVQWVSSVVYLRVTSEGVY